MYTHLFAEMSIEHSLFWYQKLISREQVFAWMNGRIIISCPLDLWKQDIEENNQRGRKKKSTKKNAERTRNVNMWKCLCEFLKLNTLFRQRVSHHLGHGKVLSHHFGLLREFNSWVFRMLKFASVYFLCT